MKTAPKKKLKKSALIIATAKQNFPEKPSANYWPRLIRKYWQVLMAQNMS